MNNRMKIMVVDDNTVNLATIEQDLSDKYDIIPMLTGRRAIKYLYRETCDLILLDVQMPIMDGIETLREIRTQENGVDVPVIFLTARRDAQTSDSNQMALYLILMGIATGVGGAYVTARRHKRDILGDQMQ